MNQKRLTSLIQQLKTLSKVIQNPPGETSSTDGITPYYEETIRDLGNLFQNPDFIRMKRDDLNNAMEADPDLAKYLRKLGFGDEDTNSEQNLPVRITHLELKNFRGFRHLILNFGSQQTSILKGANGTGKSSVMDALAILCSQWISRITRPGIPKLQLSSTDIHLGEDDCSCCLKMNMGTQEFNWSVSLGKKEFANPSSKGEYFSAVQIIRSMMHKNPTANIPLVVYYPIHRFIQKSPDISFSSESEFSLGHQYEAYRQDSGRKTDFKELFRWLRNVEEVEREEKRTNLSNGPLLRLESVRKVIEQILPGFDGLSIKRNPDQDHLSKLVIKKEGIELEINQLSDGEKIVLGMAGDLAHRLAIANPTLEKPLEGHGIVLIDEVDLHLHPQWQSRILVRLKELFPNCQFIVSTHSPLVLSYAPEAQVFSLSLDSENPEIEPIQLYGKDAGHIVEDDMGVPLRNKEVREKLGSLYEVIQNREKTSYESLMKELRELLEQDDPELIGAEVAAHRMGIT